jgi:cytochrome c-type biogenesis protein CcmF
MLLENSMYLTFWIFIILSIIGSTTIEMFLSKNKKNKLSMFLGHVGFALFILGILFVNQYQVEKDLALKVGDEVKLNRHTILFKDIKKIKGENFVGHKGVFEIKKDDQVISTIYPEKRLFIVQEIGMSETAIFTNFFYDIYIAITTPLNDSKTWAVRLYYKPCVRFIWFGGIIITASSLSALYFYRKKYNKMKI